MPPGLPGVPVPGSLKGEPGLFAALPGVVSPRSWQDWLGGPGGPGGLSARAGLASPSEKAMIRATNTDLRMTLLLLSGGAQPPGAVMGEGNTSVIPVAQQWSTALQAHKSHLEQPTRIRARPHRLSASGDMPLVCIQMPPTPGRPDCWLA